VENRAVGYEIHFAYIATHRLDPRTKIELLMQEILMATLKPRARIIRTIGDQLISGPEAALIELVKNAYDADATSVKIKIAPPCKDHRYGVVRIKDNGHGMTAADIESKWLEPATDEKKKDKLSRSKLRRVLGAKGIGRFASARLGTRTTIISRSLNDTNKIEKTKLKIDWEEFESKKYLDEIDIPITTEIASENRTGFYIQVTDLRVSWTEKSVLNLIKELRKIVSPQDIEGKFDIFLDLTCFKKNANDVGSFDGQELLKKAFLKELDIDSLKKRDPQLILPYKIQDNADYVLSGSFDALGNFNGNFTIERGDNVAQKIIVPSPKLDIDEENCGSFEIIIKIYDRENDAVLNLFKRMGISNIGIREARSILNDNSGVAIYRNGFRIRPYGEPDVDWLTLERRRVQDPSKKIGHSQISGKILIGDEDISNLVERSSREGFEHNGEFLRLRNLILNVLIRSEEKRFEYRDRAGLSRKPKSNTEDAKDKAKLVKIIEAAKNLPQAYQTKFLDIIEKESSELTKTIEDLENYQKLLESRAALGLVVAQVIHDGRRYLDPISFASQSLIKEKDFLLEATQKGEIVRKHYPMHAETISNSAKGLGNLFKSLDPISGRKRGSPNKFSILQVIEIAKDLLAESLIENDIEVILDITSTSQLYGYKSDIQNALLNIMDNAIHWLSTIDGKKREIIIFTKEENDFIFISVSNNGPLIESDFTSRLFEVGFTLKSEGHGLGLVIAREACRASKGDLYIDDAAIDTTFVITFPKEQK
jgi:signal transduction histidine kinase